MSNDYWQRVDRSRAYIDSWLRWHCPRADLTGCAVAISLRGRVLFSPYGYADASLETLLRPGNVFRVASHSKSFTATVILQLAERGALSLDDPIARHLGWLASHRDPRMNTVTVRQLLYPGIFRDGLDADFWHLGRPFPDASELEGGARRRPRLRPQPLDEVLERRLWTARPHHRRVRGRIYAEYLDECVIGPLHLSATAADLVSRLRDRAVRGHGRPEPDGTRLAIPEVGTGALAAATGVASTAPDLCTFFSALLPGSGKLLSDESKREMQRVHFRVHSPFAGDEDYGLGLSLLRIGERHTFGHSGGFPGQVSRTIADPKDGIVVSVLVNCSDGPATEVGKGV